MIETKTSQEVQQIKDGRIDELWFNDPFNSISGISVEVPREKCYQDLLLNSCYHLAILWVIGF